MQQSRSSLRWHCIQQGKCSYHECYLEKYPILYVQELFRKNGVQTQFIKATCCCCFRLATDKNELGNWMCYYCEAYNPEWKCSQCDSYPIRQITKQDKAVRKTIIRDWERRNSNIKLDHVQKKVQFSDDIQIHPISPREGRNLNLIVSEPISIPASIRNMVQRAKMQIFDTKNPFDSLFSDH